MTSFNRMGYTWAGGDYNLLTNIMRGEWGMKGFALTDYANSNNYMDVVQGLLAGGDGWDCNDATKWTDKLRNYSSDPAVATALHDATKRILYTVAHSNAMNGLSADVQVVEVRPWWKNAIVACDVVFGVLAAVSLQTGSLPAPITTVMICQDWRGILWYVVFFALYALVWYPFFKAFECQTLAEEAVAEAEA